MAIVILGNPRDNTHSPLADESSGCRTFCLRRPAGGEAIRPIDAYRLEWARII